MRLYMLGFASLLTLAACGGDKPEETAATAEASGKDAAAQVAAAAGDMRIRPGLWRVVQTDPGGQPETDEQCVTPEEAKFDPADFSDMSEQCTQTARNELGTFVWKATCPTGPNLPPSEMEFRMRTQGDTRYSGTMSASMQIPGQTARQTFSTKVEGTWIGPCPPGSEGTAE